GKRPYRAASRCGALPPRRPSDRTRGRARGAPAHRPQACTAPLARPGVRYRTTVLDRLGGVKVRTTGDGPEKAGDHGADEEATRASCRERGESTADAESRRRKENG